MKKYISLIFLAAIVIPSCTKWVDYNPHDDFKVTAQDYLASENDYRTMTVSVYTPIQWLNQLVVIGDMASDNSVTGGESASDVLSLQQIDKFTLTPVNSTLKELWQASYEGINRANYLVEHKDANPAGKNIDFAGKDALYGEVYFLRAYYYFTLVKLFGDVPLFVDKRLSLADSRKLPRSPATEVYTQIEADLRTAISALPAIQVQKGRITKYAAQALLGKVLLYEKKYNEAAPILESIITANAFNLVSNFASIYLSTGENGPESVFEIQYSNTSPYYNWDAVNRGQGNYSVQQCGVRGINGSAAMPFAAGWSTNLPTQNLASAYAAGDQRKDATILDIEAYKTAHPEYEITYQVAPYENTGLYNMKFQPRKGQTSGQVELNYLNNYRTIRYADVLLMAAEAYNKSSSPNDAKAQQYLNQVRQRAFGDNAHNITATGTALFDAIINERRLELAFDGERFFDLVRTGKAVAVLGPLGFVTGKHELFPVPEEEVRVSNLTQNPGY